MTRPALTPRRLEALDLAPRVADLRAVSPAESSLRADGVEVIPHPDDDPVEHGPARELFTGGGQHLPLPGIDVGPSRSPPSAVISARVLCIASTQPANASAPAVTPARWPAG
jgi:hypothetical protein